MKGRPPTPTKLKILMGTQRADRLNGDEPQPGGKPKCPRSLSKPVKKIWREISKVLIGIGIGTGADGWAIAALAQAWHEFELATATIDREGRCIDTKHGKRSHPAAKHQAEAMAQIRYFSGLLGMDPASRVRLHVKPKSRGVSSRDRSKGPPPPTERVS